MALFGEDKKAKEAKKRQLLGLRILPSEGLSTITKNGMY